MAILLLCARINSKPTHQTDPKNRTIRRRELDPQLLFFFFELFNILAKIQRFTAIQILTVNTTLPCPRKKSPKKKRATLPQSTNFVGESVRRAAKHTGARWRKYKWPVVCLCFLYLSPFEISHRCIDQR